MKTEALNSRISQLILAACIMFIAALIVGCSSSKKILSVKPNEHMEIGWTPRTIFQSPAYAWFDTAYTAYKPDNQYLERLKRMKDSVDILVIYGTWCSDSKREIPHFFNIMDAIQFPPERITLIAVDRTKQLPLGIAREHGITLVPTFIVKFRSLEVGRITESPKTTLEQDLVTILEPMFP